MKIVTALAFLVLATIGCSGSDEDDAKKQIRNAHAKSEHALRLNGLHANARQISGISRKVDGASLVSRFRSADALRIHRSVLPELHRLRRCTWVCAVRADMRFFHRSVLWESK